MYTFIDNRKIYIKVAKTKYEKLKGLMFKSNIKYGLFIPNCVSVHTFFMQDNIDILVLNDNNEILYKFQNMSKNKIIEVKEDINKTSILELPKNTSNNIFIGDKINFYL